MRNQDRCSYQTPGLGAIVRSAAIAHNNVFVPDFLLQTTFKVVNNVTRRLRKQTMFTAFKN